MDGGALVTPDRPPPTDLGTRRRGFWTAFLGADGCGKSSVIRRVTRDLEPEWTGVRHFHLRPHFGLRDPGGPPVTDPHADEPRGIVGGVAKLVLWWLDSTVGYLVAVRPALRRGCLVIFDRSVQDILADPLRYRFARPRPLAIALVRTIPEPDLFLVLDAPPEVLRERKREVTFAEVVRQRDAYLELASRLPNSVLIDAARSLDEVVAEVEARIRDAASSG